MTRGRRSDHTREELLELILAEGSVLMEEQGHARFSARELAKRIGYSVAMVLKVMGSSDGLVTAINTRTLTMWRRVLDERLAQNPYDRIAALVRAYYDFATANPRRWSAIYDHRSDHIPADQGDARARLTGIVVDEVAKALPGVARDEVASLCRSLIATVHGHCDYEVTGSFDLMGEPDGRRQALERVREAIAAARVRSPS